MAKLPERFVRKTARNMKIGERETFETSALEIDYDNEGFIDPDSWAIGLSFDKFNHAGERPVIELERTIEGFKLNMQQAKGLAWTPEPPEKFKAWIPVVEYVNI